ncbi:cation transporter [Enemella sp. A6]|uniref:cation transporter n=1 Tax=Enemella sp. A6 TaxID=3440152 RepID=UPI003EC06DB7
MSTDDLDEPIISPGMLRRTVLLVAALNLAYFGVEATVAASIGSVALFADSVDFLEDTAVNTLIAIALSWSLHKRAVLGKVMAGIIVLPALAAVFQAGRAIIVGHEPPDPLALALTAGGGLIVNLICTLLLSRVRRHGGSLTAAAFLAARNDLISNAAIIILGLVTWLTNSPWPDVVLGLIIVVINVRAAREVWEISEDERLAARALAGEEIDDD